jgi:hypothetical protein
MAYLKTFKLSAALLGKWKHAAFSLLCLCGLLASNPTIALAQRRGSIDSDQSEVSGSLGYFHVDGNHFYIGGEAGTTVVKDVMLSGELGIIPFTGGTAVEFEGFVQYLINQKNSKWQPFVGAGMGLGHASGGGSPDNSFKIEFGGGVRYFMNKNWGVRSDFRVGRFTGFHETTVRLTGGLFYNF